MALFINLFIAEHEHILFVVMQHWHCSVNSHLFNYFVGFFIRNYSPLGLYHFCSLYDKNCKNEISLMLSNFSNLYKITLKWVVIWLKLELNDKYQHLPMACIEVHRSLIPSRWNEGSCKMWISFRLKKLFENFIYKLIISVNSCPKNKFRIFLVWRISNS